MYNWNGETLVNESGGMEEKRKKPQHFMEEESNGGLEKSMKSSSIV